MPKRVANNLIQVFREGKIVSVKAGTAFMFTAAELEDIKRVDPNAVRMPVNEDIDPETPEQIAAREKAAREAQELRDKADKAESDRLEAENKAAIEKAEREAKEAAEAAKGNKPKGKPASDL